jgi:hypothetical protein
MWIGRVDDADGEEDAKAPSLSLSLSREARGATEVKMQEQLQQASSSRNIGQQTADRIPQITWFDPDGSCASTAWSGFSELKFVRSGT